MKPAPLLASLLTAWTFHSSMFVILAKISCLWKPNEGHFCGLRTEQNISSISHAMITLLKLRLVMLSAAHKKASSFASSLDLISAKALLLCDKTTPLWFLTTQAAPIDWLFLFQSLAMFHITQDSGGGSHLVLVWTRADSCFSSISFSTTCSRDHSSDSPKALCAISSGVHLLP